MPVNKNARKHTADTVNRNLQLTARYCGLLAGFVGAGFGVTEGLGTGVGFVVVLAGVVGFTAGVGFVVVVVVWPVDVFVSVAGFAAGTSVEIAPLVQI